MTQDSPNQTTSGSDVFVSYASQDAAVANSIVEHLEQHGVRCWIAPRDVKPGAVYADAIVRAINEANALVLVLSASAMASAHVGREVERAASKRKQIIAFRIDAAALNPALEYFLSDSQWINVPTLRMPAALNKLAEAVGQSAAASSQANPTVSRPVSISKRVIVAVAAGIAVIIASILGMHFWSSNHGVAQLPAVAAGSGPGATATPSVAIPDKSIAVLPFADMSQKKDQEYFADGMAEEVLDLLAKIPGVRVIGRTSSFQFKGKNEDLRAIGATLGATYVVEGSIRKSGDRLRVTAQLIGTRDGSHLWSETYDAGVGDVFTMQDQIATGLVRALQVTVGADERQARPALDNAEAYDAYLRGRHAYDRFDKAGFETAAGYFRQALELDPKSARAAEWLASTEENSAEWGYVPPREGFEKARASTVLALKLAPRSGSAHLTLAAIQFIYDWNWAAAMRETEVALTLEPRSPIVLGGAGQLHFALGHWDEAARLLNAALAIDPLFAGWHEVLGNTRYRTGRLAEAEAELRKTLEISPTYASGHYYLGQMLLAQGKLVPALAEMQQEAQDSGRDTGIAIVYHAMHREHESDLVLARLTKQRSDEAAFEIAEVYAYRADVDRSFEWLDRAFRLKDIELYYIKGDPLLKNLEDDARYKAFLRKMNFPE
jgi:TolB-like protein/predicted Zn-dependent protease